jgi:hypothetical protein
MNAEEGMGRLPRLDRATTSSGIYSSLSGTPVAISSGLYKSLLNHSSQLERHRPPDSTNPDLPLQLLRRLDEHDDGNWRR